MFRFTSSLAAIGFLVFSAGSSLAQKPELVVQTGHSRVVNAVSFSPDGKTLVTGSDDETIKLWDVSTGSELRTIKALADVLTVAVSPDGKTLASGGHGNAINLWDVSTGAQLHSLKDQLEPAISALISVTFRPDLIVATSRQGRIGGTAVYSVAFSPDAKTLASGGSDGVSLWDVSTGVELSTVKGHSRSVRSVAFSPNGKSLASGGSDGVKLWDVSTGAELSTFEGHSQSVWSVAFSPNGKTLASGGSDGVRLLDVSTGAELSTLKGHSQSVRSVAFSPNGKTLASAGSDGVKLWDVSTGAELSTLKEHSQSVWSVAFSPNGKTLASVGSDGVRLWDVSTGAELSTLKGHSQSVWSVAFSPNGKTLASVGVGDAVKLWNPSTGGELRSLRGHSSHYVDLVAFSLDGKTLATGGLDGVKLWEVSTEAELRTLKGHSSDVGSVAFSPDGKTLATGSGDSTIKLWDVFTGSELRTFIGHSKAVKSVSFSSDGKTLATGSSDGTIKLWDVFTGSELRTLKVPDINRVAFSPDLKTLASTSPASGVRLWDVSTGAELTTFKENSQFVCSLTFSPNGKTLATGSCDKTITLWEVASGRELNTLDGHSYQVLSVAFSPDGRTLASGGGDGRVNLWDVNSGNNLASLIALDEKDWVVTTPDGLFDGSPAAWNQIIWRFNNNTVNYAPVEAFFSDFYYPGLLTDIFAGKHPKAPSDISQKDRRQPQLKLTLAEAQPDVTLTTRNTRVKIDVSEAPAGAQDVRLFRNGSLVKTWRGDVLQGKSSVTLETTIPIVAGENRLTAYAFNHDNIKSSDATLTIEGADSLNRKGVGYVLAVGLNEYANSQYNLKFAVADAQDFAEELRRQQAKLNNYDHVEVISLTDKDATKANILKSLTALSAKVQPEDALVVFFAGHGTAQQKRFYLIPHDLGYTGSRTGLDSVALQNILAHSISDEELERAVEGIDAGQMLLVIDACNSGQALEAEEKRRGPMNSKGLAQLAYEKGMYILTAAQSYQAAQEAERYGHGFLTYALVEEGLKTDRADLSPKDGQVMLREWLDFATERVPQMQQDKLDEQKKQGRQLDRIKFAEADSGNERSIQRPRVFYRRETETRPLVVAKP